MFITNLKYTKLEFSHLRVREWILSWFLSHFGIRVRFQIQSWVWVKESTESLSFLRVFLKERVATLKTLLCGHFFAKLTSPLRSEGRKTLDLRFLSPKEPPRDAKRLAGPPPAATHSRRKSEVEDDQSAANSAATCHFQPITYRHVSTTHITLGLSSHRQVSHHIPATCHLVSRHHPVTQISRNNIFVLKLFVITELPQNELKIQNYPYTFKNCTITPVFFEIAKLPLFFLKLQFYPC